MDAVRPSGVYPPVISRTLSSGKRNLLLEEQLLTQPFVFVKRSRHQKYDQICDRKTNCQMVHRSGKGDGAGKRLVG